MTPPVRELGGLLAERDDVPPGDAVGHAFLDRRRRKILADHIPREGFRPATEFSARG
jgi:hypothetical protein